MGFVSRGPEEAAMTLQVYFKIKYYQITGKNYWLILTP